MKSFQLSRFFSLLLITAIAVVTVALMKDLLVAVILSAFQLNDYIVPLIVERGTRWRGWGLWVCASSALAGAYYLVDLFLMPANHTPFHSREVAFLSILSMVGGLAATYYAPSARAKAVQ